MSSNKKIAVVLSGCGRMDGSEIHEATMALLAIDMAGFAYQCFAPNMKQAKVLNHITGDIMSITGDKFDRSVLIESARIARGDIKDLNTFDAKDFSAIVFPGGIGAISNLCNYDIKKTDCHVNPAVQKAINESYERGVIIGAMCIVPVLIAKVLGSNGILVTIGNDIETSSDIKKMGAKHLDTPPTQVCVDKTHKIVTTPAYMTCKTIKEVHEGANKFIAEIVNLIN